MNAIEFSNASIQRVYVDARSAGAPRISGWERYARAIACRLVRFPEFCVRSDVALDFVHRATSDLVGIPRESRGFQLRHHLTYPPAQISRNQPTVFTLHDLVWWLYPETASKGGRYYYRHLAESALRKCNVVSVAFSTADHIRSRFDLEEVTVVNPIIDLPDQSDEDFHTGRTRPYLVYVGSIEPRKNLRRLSSAFCNSVLKSEFDLIVVGRRAWGKLPDGVLEVGTVDDKRLRTLIAGAQGLVLPSLYEGFGIPIIEAQALGTPVFCSDIPVFREVSGGFAHFFDPLEVDSIRDVLESSIDLNPGIQLGRENSRRYSAENAMSQLRQLYKSFDLPVDHLV